MSARFQAYFDKAGMEAAMLQAAKAYNGSSAGSSPIIYSTLALTDFAASVPIGTAAATVDLYPSFTINQTSVGKTLSLPFPTAMRTGQVALVTNIGTAQFQMHGTTIEGGKTAYFLWEDNGGTGSPAWRGLENADLVGFTGVSNTGLGVGAGSAITGTKLTALGVNAVSQSTADENTGIGWNALALNLAGNRNTAVGSESLANNDGGLRNTAMGVRAARDITSQSDCAAFGYQAAVQNTADQTTALGSQALTSNLIGIENTAVGYRSLFFNTSDKNTAVGFQALKDISLGSDNTGIGSRAGSGTTTTSHNTAVGSNALSNSAFNFNVAIGSQALAAGPFSTRNTAVGYSALTANAADLAQTQGVDNVAVGASGLLGNVTGRQLVAVGSGALQGNIGASDCTAVGFRALFASTGANNTVIGSSSFNAVLGGSGNTGLGVNVGIGASGGAALTTGTNNTLLGQNTDVNAAAAARRIAIGSGTVALLDDGLYFPIGLAGSTSSGLPVHFNSATGQMYPLTPANARVFPSVTPFVVAAAFTAIPGAVIALPVAGTYRLYYTGRAGASTANEFCVFRMFNVTAGSAVPNTECLAVLVAAGTGQGSGTLETRITVAGATSIRLEASSSAGTGNVISDGFGVTYIGFEQI